MDHSEITKDDAVTVPGELTFLRLGAIDREMRTLRQRLEALEARKAGLMTNLMAVLVAKSLAPDRATRRPGSPVLPDHASEAGTSVTHPDPAGRSFTRPPRLLAEGRAPYGFAARIRMLAHRSIALANRPLQRAEILDDILASGTPLPKTFLPQKVSRVLARDEDLLNKRGEGYVLTAAALDRELRLIRREEGPIPETASMDRADPAEADDETDDVMFGYGGPSSG